ncbi:hypothetical protein EYF80_047565 [Liparis tanakae]|uniref:Uncharacterized protein n=1 Tax=Liparis tanakae TaxID=230148 RepID=A0A4Z2FN48_9TELE|nr:hypothetical protein EYF80_047565 [Liparis tanakae]
MDKETGIRRQGEGDREKETGRRRRGEGGDQTPDGSVGVGSLVSDSPGGTGTSSKRTFYSWRTKYCKY